MTNRELRNTPHALLSEVDRQRPLLLRVEGAAMPCPACPKAVNVFDAAGLDIDQHDFSKTRPTYRCPACSAELEPVVPVFSLGPLWPWQLKDEGRQRQLEKAREFDQQVKQEGGASCP
jgi:hypothetical protein